MRIDDSGKKAVIHASVPEELAQGLKAVAEAADRSLSAELRRAVAEHLAQHERKDGNA
jgi:predicted transcriptional regulator